MHIKLKAISFGIVMAGLLYVGNHYASKNGAAGGIKQCYNNAQEKSHRGCDQKAAAFIERYGHAFDQ